VLSDHYEGADFFDKLVLDAHRGEINKVLVVNEETEFLATEDVRTSKGTVWDDRIAAGEYFVRLDKAIQAIFCARQRGQNRDGNSETGTRSGKMNCLVRPRCG
jgi:hypothetical protein